MDGNSLPWMQSFSRRHGRSLPPRQKQLMCEYFPQFEIARDSDEPIDPKVLFAVGGRVHLEIGFGAGEHLLGVAQQYPQDVFIGCEPFINGVSSLVSELDALRQADDEVSNIRLFTDDARLLIDRLPHASVHHVYILFPDPWPKVRHHKRRLVSQDLLTRLAHLQPVGGKLLLATDHEDYAVWMLEHVMAHDSYEWVAESQSDWQNAPQDWVTTRYEEKTRAQGRAPTFIQCVRAS